MIKQLSTKIVYENPWMKVREDQVEFIGGHTGIYGVIEKSHFAIIIPYDGENFHLVKQYRYAISLNSVEFPQGVHEDEEDIDPLTLAKAELLEETGLIAHTMIHIGFLYEAGGYCNQGFHIYFATDLTQRESKLDLTEEGLEKLIMTPEEFEQAVISGGITDAPTVSAYGLLKMKKVL